MKLRLGPLPKTDVVKLTISLPIQLKADLDLYAELHAATWGDPVDTTTLIPHMLAQYIARDRAFRTSSRRRTLHSGSRSG